MTQVQLDNVIYNAATQSFEALVSVRSNGGTRRYACAIDAPITMSFEQAAEGLRTQALRRHSSGRGLYSQMKRHAPSLRAGREKFDPRRWLSELFMPRSDAA
ncbi:orotidine 5-phosphate decarboxylase [Sulfitobacter sp. HNIBRBA3233]|uniref:orotidine 5-phosphate decarboxylase n=1 Tax=Sulfitobacter marinivivus TaxID=3158558 RepID=UPI0032DE7B3C